MNKSFTLTPLKFQVPKGAITQKRKNALRYTISYSSNSIGKNTPTLFILRKTTFFIRI